MSSILLLLHVKNQVQFFSNIIFNISYYFNASKTVLDDLSDDGSNKKGVKQNTVVNDFDEEWFVQHCRQVSILTFLSIKVFSVNFQIPS